MPADTQCIRLEGVAYVRIAGKEAVSTLSLAYREAASAEPLLRSMLTWLRARDATARV